MRIQTIENAEAQMIAQRDSKLGSAKLFLIKVDINKKNNSLKEPSDVLGNIVGENLPDDLYQTVTDAINKENSIVIDREEFKELTNFQETVFIEDADRNIQESLIEDASDYSKTAIALIKDEEVVAYANYQDVYEKVHGPKTSKKEELIALKNMLEATKTVKQDTSIEVTSGGKSR